jgi:glycosyltransferase involved in cell wall biosynthesis
MRADVAQMIDLEVSLVIPVLDEAGNLAPLMAEIATVMGDRRDRYEVIFVDDGSGDGGPEELHALCGAYPTVRALFHRETFGQSAALATGVRHARGRVIVTMDADRQHDPIDVPRLVAGLGAEVACACGVRVDRRDAVVTRIGSRLANGFRELVTRDRLRDAGCCFRAIRREALAELPVWNGMHRFLPTLLRAQGLRVAEVPVTHRPRTVGASKYGIWNRLWRGIGDCFAVRWYRARAVPLDRIRSG